MLKLNVKAEPLRDKRTGRFVSRAAFRNIFHASASIAKDMKGSIRTSERPAPAGQPPRTRRRKRLKFAIRFAVDKQKNRSVIGPRASIVGKAGKAHEFGGSYKGESFEARPFAQPALERGIPRFAGSFRGSIGG